MYNLLYMETIFSMLRIAYQNKEFSFATVAPMWWWLCSEYKFMCIQYAQIWGQSSECHIYIYSRQQNPYNVLYF